MWTAHIFIKNRIDKINTELDITFPHFYRYSHLYNDIMSEIGSDNIKLEFRNSNKVITNDKYILNNTTIDVILYDPTIFYYALFTESGEKLMVTSKIKSIYEDIKIEHVKETLEIHKVNECGRKIGLVDVIINGKQMYNELINRLIFNYGW